MPVAAYSRVSSDEQAERQTIQTQREFLRRYLDLHGVSEVTEYLDDGVSGTVDLARRPEGARLLQDLDSGRIQVVYVYRLDRLGRDPRLLLNTVNRLEQARVRLVSATESFDTSTPAGRAMLGMLAVFAGFERDSIVARMREGMARGVREGRWMGGRHVPYGYCLENGRLAPNLTPIPDHTLSPAEVVGLIYTTLVGGVSCYGIAAYLDSLGIPTVRREERGSGWCVSQISTMIRSSTYRGERVWGNLSHPCPSLIDSKTWERAQEQLRLNQRNGNGSRHRLYLLRGLVRCGLCGGTYYGWSRCRTYAYYGCRNRRSREERGAGCRNRNVRAAELEGEVWALVEAELSRPSPVYQWPAGSAASPSVDPELRRVDAALGEKTEERGRVLALRIKGRVSEEEAEVLLDGIAEEQRVLLDRRAALLDAEKRARLAAEWERTVGVLLERMRAELRDGLTPEGKRTALVGLVREVTVYPQRVEVRWVF